MGKNTPEPIKRQLRQESCFGCAKCGNPIIEFHHIIPRHEEQHFDPNHMIALCPTHHTELAKLGRNICYELKKNPYNKKKEILSGLLGSDKEHLEYIIGSARFRNTPIIFEYYKIPIFQMELIDGQNLISVCIPDENYWPELTIKRNELMANTKKMWDIEFRTNFLSIKRKEREYFFELDLREDTAKVRAKFALGGEEIEFGPNGTNIPGIDLHNATINNCPIGIALDDGKHRLILPNFAMARPQPWHYQIS